MQTLRIFLTKFHSAFSAQILSPIRENTSKKWNEFKRYPYETIINIFTWLALLEIVIAFSWLIIQTGKINQQVVLSENLEQGAIQIRIHYPLYVGQGEEGKIGIDVENIGQQDVREINIFIRESDDNYFWFPNGNFTKFSNLQQDTTQYSEISYIVGNSVPKNINSLHLIITASYRFSSNNSSQTSESVLPPLSRVQFPDTPEIKIDEIKGGLEAGGRGFSEGLLGLSSIENLLGLLGAILASFIAIRGYLIDVSGRKKS